MQEAIHSWNPYKTYFFHFRPLEGKYQALTVAVLHLGDRLVSGVAACSRSDTFCKKIGRKIAEGRARKCAIFREGLLTYNNPCYAPFTPVSMEKVREVAQHTGEKSLKYEDYFRENSQWIYPI